MAEAITRKVLADHLKVQPSQLEQAGYIIRSAGTMALHGAPATPNAIEAVRALGADLSGHRSQPLTPELAQNADRIFAMGQSHLQAIRQTLSTAIVRSSTLDPKGDIDDPIGGDLGLYRALAAEILSIVQQRLADRSLFGTEMGK
jgi:protein-tyrosine phosphatase